jgi:hypothetical protein
MPLGIQVTLREVARTTARTICTPYFGYPDYRVENHVITNS